MVRYREWCGASKPKLGLRLDVEQVAEGIMARQVPGERIEYTVVDPAMFAQGGGPSLAERMARKGVHPRPADNTRVRRLGAMAGWDQLRARLRGDVEGRPMLVVFDKCKDFVRTVPVLPHDQTRAEDLDMEAEDHAADECRYACMSRQSVREVKREPVKPLTRRDPAWQLPPPPGPRMRSRIRV